MSIPSMEFRVWHDLAAVSLPPTEIGDMFLRSSCLPPAVLKPGRGIRLVER